MRIWESESGHKCLFRFSLVKKAAFHSHPLCHHLIIKTSCVGYLYINWAMSERIKVPNNNWDSLEEKKGVKLEWKDTKGNYSISPLPRIFHFWKSLDSQKDSIDSLYYFVFFQGRPSPNTGILFFISPAVIDFCRMVMSMNFKTEWRVCGKAT